MTLTEKQIFYEKVKRKNFIASCKLDGIDIKPTNLTLKQVLDKYKKDSQ